MRIASWNVNSLRARSDQLLRWLDERSIDVALLQETKCGDEHVPFEALEAAGYQAAHHGVNHWNGVAILSRVGLDDVVRGFAAASAAPFDEPRLVSATCGGVRFWSVYVPNGRSVDDPHFGFKLKWLERLGGDLLTNGAAQSPSLVAGDFNVGLADIDFYDPKRWVGKKHATSDERDRVNAILELGFVDLARHEHPEQPMFTWWNYVGTQFAKDKGLRIDLALGSSAIAVRVDDVWVDRHARDPLALEPAKPSDHAPLIIDLD